MRFLTIVENSLRDGVDQPELLLYGAIQLFYVLHDVFRMKFGDSFVEFRLLLRRFRIVDNYFYRLITPFWAVSKVYAAGASGMNDPGVAARSSRRACVPPSAVG